jgi:site-specific DNA-methyltransferase (adenine-specific)
MNNKGGASVNKQGWDSGQKQIDITAPATEEAKKWDGWGSALKPANEPIVLARKPLEKGLSIVENVLKWGTGGINIDGCRVFTNEKLNYGNGIKSNVGFKTSPQNNQRPTYNGEGRFPANIILTHHPECECKGFKKVKPSNGSGKASGTNNKFNNGIFQDENRKGKCIEGGYGEETIEDCNCHPDCPIKIMDEQSGESKSRKSAKLYINNTEGRSVKNGASGFRDPNSTYSDSGGASRFFYVAKASKSERNKGLEGFEEKFSPTMGDGIGLKEHNKESATKKANFHPTVKPVKLMQYLARLITPPNGKVLDPFCGSGTTGVACKLEKFNFVGMEQDPEYAKIAEARIKNTLIENTLW